MFAAPCIAMSNYEMPNPRAWLTAASESLMDACTAQRVQWGQTDPFTCFMQVLRRSNPLVPPLITGPLNTLAMRLQAFWHSVPSDSVLHHGLKSELLAGFSRRLQGLPIFNGNREPDRLALEGLQFYIRRPSQSPEEPPFPSAKRDERLEAIESIYFLTIILSTAQDAPLVSEMPEGPLEYIPYYCDVPFITVPKRRNAASLAMAAKFFRQDTRPPRFRVFDFDLTVQQWMWAPDEPQAAPLDRDEDGYRHIAQVSANKSTRHSAISYFVLKLLAVMKEVRAHRPCLWPLVEIDGAFCSGGVRGRLTLTIALPRCMRTYTPPSH
jgi:hypothetical protein